MNRVMRERLAERIGAIPSFRKAVGLDWLRVARIAADSVCDDLGIKEVSTYLAYHQQLVEMAVDPDRYRDEMEHQLRMNMARHIMEGSAAQVATTKFPDPKEMGRMEMRALVITRLPT